MLGVNRHNRDVASVAAICLLTHTQHRLLARSAVKEGVEVVRGMQLATVDGEQVLAFDDVDAGPTSMAQ
jgi:hypothetical protein